MEEVYNWPAYEEGIAAFKRKDWEKSIHSRRFWSEHHG